MGKLEKKTKTLVNKSLKYTNAMADIFRNCLLEGKTIRETIEFMGISSATLYDWLSKYPEMQQAYKQGSQATGEVAKALYDRAVGYNYTERSTKKTGDGIETTVSEKHNPPSVQAIKMYLENRSSSKWKDKTTVEHTRSLETVILSDDIQDAEIVEGDD